MIKRLFEYWQLKILIVILLTFISIGIINKNQISGYFQIVYLFPILYWILISVILKKFDDEFGFKRERLIVFGLYSKSIKGYLSYYLDENDAIRQLEKRSKGLNIDYQRGVSLNERGDTVFSIHPIVIIK